MKCFLIALNFYNAPKWEKKKLIQKRKPDFVCDWEKIMHFVFLFYFTSPIGKQHQKRILRTGIRQTCQLSSSRTIPFVKLTGG